MRKNERTELVQKVINIILTGKNEDFSFISAGWLARKVNTSPANLARVFKRETGRTLQRFLISEKLYRSAVLFSEYRDIKVGEAAAAVDYRSTSHFISVFKKNYGASPNMYHRYVPRKRTISKKKRK